MIERFLPARFDNVFPGQKIALWAFYVLTAVTLWRSQHHIFAADGGAQSIATIPLDSYSDGAAATIIAIFAQWGLVQLLLGMVMLLAAVRYNSMVPLMWLIVLVEWIGRGLIGQFKPVETIGTAPGQVGNMMIPIIALVMLVLSLIPPRKAKD
ncbi:hypothetical protein [Sphingorhabdus sp. EL138]|jgi:hypothetical protein|uniref:hypothetical protein n=1 Tax=Sphingorhabdus sp. EL138 TaxID=2073156 RepID=UPI000D69BDCB|nr:hypothetical protein [Sphingorhabdus sp. EL138]